MAGRRRRVSSSSVAAVADRHMRWTKETAVLRPVPKDTHSDDWPCFVLTNAVIYDKTGKNLANVLFADLEGPFIVRGFLEVEEQDQLQHLVRQSVKSAHVEISSSWSYSIGFGPYPVLWASGEAGWFEIMPSEEYKAVYDKMCEGITLYYKILEAYETVRNAKKQKKRSHVVITLDEIFLRYAVAVGDGVVREEVERRCHDHARFLIAHFPKEDNFPWITTNFYKWITREHPDIVKRLQDMASGVVQKPDAPSGRQLFLSEPPSSSTPSALPFRESPRNRQAHDSTPNRSTSDVEMSDALPAQKNVHLPKSSPKPQPVKTQSPKQFGEGPPTRQESQSESEDDAGPSTGSRVSPPPAQSEHSLGAAAGDQSQDPFAALKIALGVLAGEVNPAKVKPTSVPNKLYFICRIKNYFAAKEIIRYFSKQLADDPPPAWRGTPFHEWLKEESKQPFTSPTTVDPADMLRQLQPRAKSQRTPAAKPAPRVVDIKGKSRASDDQLVGDPMETESDEPRPPPRSSKQPKPPMAGRRSGKAAGLRLLSSVAKKRLTASLDDDESQGSQRGRKSAKTSHNYDDDDDDDDDTNETNGTSDDATPRDEDDDAPSPPRKETVRLVVHAERMPTMSPSGPNGTWVCAEPDCGYVVRAANDAEGQQIIQDHFREHERQADKINLAVAEGRRGHMPIDHLLEKIQNLGKKSAISDPGVKSEGDQKYPFPINRRVLI